MPPKATAGVKRKQDAPDPRQQGIAAAFQRRPTEAAAVEAGALRVEHFARKLEDVTEMDDYSVNNVINEAGDAHDEEERAGEGAPRHSPGLSLAARSRLFLRPRRAAVRGGAGGADAVQAAARGAPVRPRVPAPALPPSPPPLTRPSSRASHRPGT